jgi:ribosome recycling factor
MEEIDLYIEESQDLMKKAVEHTGKELTKIRAGKASPSMLYGILVEYYGTDTPIEQVSSISTPDARTISIKPFEKGILKDVETAIIHSDLGLNPQNDGEFIRISVPPLTEERRKNLVKQAKSETESGKVSIRNIRKDTNNSLKSLQKEGASEDMIKSAEEKIQQFTDKYSKDLDALLEKKEEDILTI